MSLITQILRELNRRKMTLGEMFMLLWPNNMEGDKNNQGHILLLLHIIMAQNLVMIIFAVIQKCITNKIIDYITFGH